MIVNSKNKKQYEIELPNGKIIKGVWFIGKQLEVILKAYNIPYKIIDRKKDSNENNRKSR